MYGLFRILLALWAFAYPVIACGPLVIGATQDTPGALVGVVASLILGSALLGPWIVGLIILGALTWLTRPSATASVPGQSGPRSGAPSAPVILDARGNRVVDATPAAGRTASPQPDRAFVDWQLLAGIALVIGGVVVLIALVAQGGR